MPTFETWVSHQRSWYKEVGQPGCLQGNHVATLCNDVTTDTPFAWDGYLTHAETPAASFLVVRMLLVVRPGAPSVLAPSSKAGAPSSFLFLVVVSSNPMAMDGLQPRRNGCFIQMRITAPRFNTCLLNPCALASRRSEDSGDVGGSEKSIRSPSGSWVINNWSY